MRIDNFIRMPLKNGQFIEDDSFIISEVSTKANFGKNNSCPQSMKVKFIPIDKDKGTQINLIWGGYLEFEAKEDLSGLKIDNITTEYFNDNNIIGSLIITSKDNLKQMNLLLENIKILKKPPSSIRYEFIKLTTSFLFTSLKNIKMKFKYFDETISINEDNEMTDEILKKIIHLFVLGQISIPIFQDSNDFKNDFTELDMPIVEGNVLEISMSSESPEKMDWYIANKNDYIGLESSYDTLVVDQNNLKKNNPRHPRHSIIPCLFILSEVSDFFTNLNGYFEEYFLNYLKERKINYILLNFLRPHYSDEYIDITKNINNNPFSNEHRRQYPLHAVKLERKNIKFEYRLPISGLLYIPLKFDTNMTTRLKVTQINSTSGAMTLSKPNTENSNLLMTIGKSRISLNFNESSIEKIIYVNCLEYDGMMIWNRYVNKKVKKTKIAEAYKLRTKDLKRWFISQRETAKNRSIIYGYIRESASRHRLSPEFLQAVLIGEGGASILSYSKADYRLNQELPSGDYLGLDTIADGLQNKKLLYPDIGYKYLVDNKYLNPDKYPSSLIVNIKKTPTYINEPARNHYLGTIKGWEMAIELIASSLNARLHMMINPKLNLPSKNNNSKIEIKRNWNSITSNIRSYLAYVRYNATLENRNWVRISNNIFENNSTYIDTEIKEYKQLIWKSKPKHGDKKKKYPDESDEKLVDEDFSAIDRIHFKAIRLVAISDWFKKGGYYR